MNRSSDPKAVRSIAAWVGGFLAGPLPAAIVLIVDRDDRQSWQFRKSLHAFLFWVTVVAAWLAVVVVDVGFRSGPNAVFFAAWLIAVVSSIVMTIVQCVLIYRKMTTSRGSLSSRNA